MSWVVGVAVVLILGYITVNTLTHQGGGSRGVEAGDRAPAFAMPLAGSTVEGDSNLRERAQDGHPAACDVRGKDVLNICELYEQGPTAVIFIATRSRRCIEQLDVVERVHRRFPQWRFAGVSIRGDRGDLRWDLAKGRWTVPLGYDRDGATANAYSVAVCPTVTFIRKGGVVAKTSLTFLDDRELAAELSRLG